MDPRVRGALGGLAVDQVEHLVPGQPHPLRPEVDDHAEAEDDQDVPPERDVASVRRRQRVLVGRGRAAELALPGNDAHAGQVERQPGGGAPVQRRPLRVKRHPDADQHVADHDADA